jgi:1,3-beta-glucan synthase
MGVSDFSTATIADFGSARDAYSAWSTERQIPLSKEEIEDIFLDLTQKFGFQRDSMRNMVGVTHAPTHWRQVTHPLYAPRYQFDFTMQLLDSRASRMPPNQALLTLHADYIGGQNANYRKWYFAAQLDLDEAVGQTQNPGLPRFGSVKFNKNLKKGSSVKYLNTANERWRQAMNTMSQYDRMRQIALYLLCWGEAAQVRFVPECLCFIFKCADDYYRSPECQSRVQPVKEGLYLQTVIKPLYRFIRDQGYEVIDGRFVRRERDHTDIIGYDDVNQLFWYPEGIARIMLKDNVGSPP